MPPWAEACPARGAEPESEPFELFEPGRLELGMETYLRLFLLRANTSRAGGITRGHFRRSRADRTGSCICPIGQMTLRPPALKPRGPV